MLILGIIISYLLGSIPSAYILGRILKGIDIRDFGSGNVGATNAFRVLGPKPAAIVLVTDVLKAVVTVIWVGNYFLPYWGYSELSLRIMFGLVCICGHNWTVFLGFKGGKGVATSLGVLTGLGVMLVELRLILILVILVWAVTFLALRLVSVASILSAISLPIFVITFQRSGELLFLSIILAIFVVFRHKKNIIGLVSGKEQALIRKNKAKNEQKH